MGVVPKYPEGGISTGEQVEEVVGVVVISESSGELENSFQHMEEGGGGGGGGGGGRHESSVLDVEGEKGESGRETGQWVWFLNILKEEFQQVNRWKR